MNLSKMTTEDLELLNKQVVTEIRNRRCTEATEAASKFQLGQIVEFRNGRSPFSPIVKMKITKINPASIGGEEVNNPLKRWRVHPTLLKASA